MTTDDKEIVSAVQAALVDKVGRSRFDVWFGANAMLRLESRGLVVAAASRFYHDWLQANFRGEIELACREVLGRPAPVYFEIEPLAFNGEASDSQTKQSPPRREPSAERTPSGAAANGDRSGVEMATAERFPTGRGMQRLAQRPFADLQSFVVGAANRVAHSAARSVSERPGEVSPLVLHGPTSSGKSHLLEGILGAAVRARPDLSAVYLTAEQFTTYFLQALHGSGMPNFRRKYRGVQMLLIDDVQFLAGKKATLIELLHTIDAFLRDGRQLVLALDRPPADVPDLGSELVTRLQGGLVCRLEWPDAAMRRNIVREMSQRFALQTPDCVLDYIADNVASHARELSGALKRLAATSQALGEPISLVMAEEALRDLVVDSARSVRMADIEAAVCDVFGVDATALQSDGRGRTVSQPRMVAMWLARKHTRAAYSEIGQYFGRRSHSTVIAANRTVGDWMRRRTTLELAGAPCRIEEAIRRVEAKLKAG